VDGRGWGVSGWVSGGGARLLLLPLLLRLQHGTPWQQLHAQVPVCRANHQPAAAAGGPPVPYAGAALVRANLQRVDRAR
jgi:hypothetical protein